MKRNPVYSREMRVGSRSARLPVVIAVFNGILALAALINMYSAVNQVKTSAAIQYTRFMDMYELVATLAFVLLVFLSPAVTAASISGERERQTLDLMLSTQMTAAQIVVGKLMAALAAQFLLILSACPLVAMVFVYGGITWGDALELLLCYVAASFFAGSLGICCSSFFKRSTISTVVTYWIMTAVFYQSVCPVHVLYEPAEFRTPLWGRSGDCPPVFRRCVLPLPLKSRRHLSGNHGRTGGKKYSHV